MRFLSWATIVLSALFIVGCKSEVSSDNLQDLATSTVLTPAVTSTIAPSPTVNPDSGWETLTTGMERRELNLFSDSGSLFETIYLLRIDPGFFRFDVGYSPAAPLSLESWQNQTGAAIVINGGYYDENNEATGLVITDGKPSGTSYQGFGGMFAVDSAGSELRWLLQQPYDAHENLVAALQSFPMLVLPGGEIPSLNDSGDVARRTVIGEDQDGKWIILVTGIGRFSLSELSRYLASSDLNLDRALNLDGGASSGVLVAEPSEGVSAFSLLPTVILVYGK